MSKSKEIGEVENKKIYEEAHIEWKIPDFFSADKENHQWHSPTFAFAGASWYLILFPKSMSISGSLTVFLYNRSLRDYSVEYDFGLKKLDGSVEKLFAGILQGKQKCSDYCGSIKLSKVQEQKSQVVPSDVLTITCTVKRETTKPSEAHLISLDTLSEDFRDLFGNKESCDTTLRVKDKEYKAHRAVLIARSAVFAAMFQHDTAEKQTGIISIPDCEPESFQQFLEYLYCGKLEGVSFHAAFHLYNTSDKYDVQKLKAFCVEYLMQCISAENICDIVTLADKYDEKNLFLAAQDFFNRNLNQILETSEWECLLKDNYRSAKKLLKGMASKVKVVD